MTDAQKAILDSFPKADRGLFGEEGSDHEEEKTAVEEDFVEAAAKKAKIKQKAMRQKRKEREAENGDEELSKKRVRFVNDEEEELNSDDELEEGSDSDEIVYDSEEEDEAQRQFEERKEKSKTTMINTEDAKAPESLYDIEAEVKKVQKFKPIEGVKFKQFDALGLPIDDGFDYYKYITTDTNTLDTVIDASPDQMEAAYHPKGERHDQDKEEHEMNDEGK